MNPIKAHLNRFHKNKEGKYLIYVSTTLSRERIQFSTGIRVLLSEWDKKKQCVKESVPNYNDYNLIINNIKARITQIFVRYKLEFEVLTPTLLRSEYKIIESAIDFHTYATTKLEQRKKHLEIGSYNRHVSQLKKIKEFAPELLIKEVDEEFIENYISWCRKVKKNKQTTIRGSTNALKVYVNFAVKEKLLNKNPFENIRIAEGNSYREFLSIEELDQLYQFYILNRLSITRQEVLRTFLFSCLTGLRLSDVKLLSLSDIRNNEITITMSKTKNTSGKVVKIPLNDRALLLLEGKNATNIQKPIFDLPSDVRVNLYLKDIISMLEINKNISYHLARHIENH